MMIFQAKILVEKHVIKKNNRPIFRRMGRPFIGKSKELVRAENDLISILKISHDHIIQGPIYAAFEFGLKDYFTKKGERNKKQPDLSNLVQLPEDCLQDAGVIENDTDIIKLIATKVPSKENYVLIKIWRANDMPKDQLSEAT